MNEILNAIKAIIPEYNRCLNLMDSVNTESLNERMFKKVQECFSILKPFRREGVVVINVGEKYRRQGYSNIILSGCLRHKWGDYNTRGSNFFHYMYNFGDLFVQHIRKQIRQEFATLVDLTKQLRVYSTLRIEKEIPPTTIRIYRIDDYSRPTIRIESVTTSKIILKTFSPWKIYIDGNFINLKSRKDVLSFENILGYVVEGFEYLKEQVDVIQEHNEKILDKMEKAVELRRIAHSLSKKNSLKKGENYNEYQ